MRPVAAFARGTGYAFWTLLLARTVWSIARFRGPDESIGLLLADRYARDAPRLLLLSAVAGLAAAAVGPLVRGTRTRLGAGGFLFGGALLASIAFPVARALDPPLFADVTRGSGAAAPSDLVADAFDAACADADGDGDLDLLVNHHQLREMGFLRNEGGFRFRESAEEAGLVAELGVRAVVGAPGSAPADGEFQVFHEPPRGESRLGPWRIRWRAGSRGVRVDGTVETNGAIVRANGSGAAVEVAGDARSLRFDARDARAEGAVEFFTRELEGDYRFDLRIDGRSDPSRVVVGRRGVRPPAMPLRIVLGDPHGVAFGDADGDGDPDLFVTHGAMQGELRPPSLPKRDALFRNDAGGFVERSSDLGVENPYGRGRCAAWLDLDRDRRPDLFVGNLRGASLLFRGTPEGRFVECASDRGLALDSASSFRWFDLEGDGDLDLLALAPLALLRNDGSDGFREVDDAAGLPRGAFASRAASGLFPETSASFADVDGDGDQDLYLGGPAPEGGRLFARTGARFAEALARSGFPSGGRHAAFADYDADGRVDAYLVMGTGPGRLLRNDGDGRFSDRTRACGLAIDGSVGRSALWFDADGDGALDLFVLNRTGRRPWDRYFEPGGPHRLFRNRGSATNGWISVSLRPRGGAALGARVRVETEAGAQVQVAGDRWFTPYGQSLAPLHFGLGAAGAIRSLEVAWPSGATSRLEGVGKNRAIVVEEP